jgi:N-acetylglucosaminyldiphosphoundecaprenol N-acetyl-beta-D-mannosaminyltransferase
MGPGQSESTCSGVIAGVISVDRIDVLGLGFDSLTKEEALKRVSSFAGSERPHLIVTANPETVMQSRGDQLLAQIVNRADLVVADGIGVVWASGVLGRRLPERIAGIELTEGILAEAAAKGWPVFMLGSSDGVAQRAADALRRRYQGLQIVGTHHGFFRPGPEEEEVLERIKGAKPKVLLAALGVPRQEKWLAAHLGTLRVPVAIGVGGSFDVWAGVTRRAPKWVRQLHLEWLYRVLRQPSRFKRLLVLPKFVALVYQTKLRRGR